MPDISAFLLVTGFPNLPIVIGLTIAPAQSLPLERLLGVPLLLFTIVEIVLAYSAVTSFVRSQTAQFYRLVLEDSITGQGGVTGAQVGGYSGVPSHQIRSGLKLPSGTATSDGNSPPASPHSDLSGDEEDEQGGRRGGAGSVPAAQLHRRRSGGRQGTVPRADSSADRGGRAIRSPEGGVQGGLQQSRCQTLCPTVPGALRRDWAADAVEEMHPPLNRGARGGAAPAADGSACSRRIGVLRWMMMMGIDCTECVYLQHCTVWLYVSAAG